MTHPIRRRWLAEQLVRLRRADERQRYAASQRRGRIDPNPHQIHAVIFALGRVRDGGCILADEVGLGKTIEAGLVIVQLMAEGASRVLIVVPKPLQGQWQQELYTLFGVEVRQGASGDDGALDGGGVFLVGREWAGGEKGAGALKAAEPFDLCVIDEAHEIFAGLYKRYDRFGVYQPASPHAQTAGRVKELLAGTPVLLLTATPIQNSLAELWGLVQYVEPTGTLLGDVSTFRQVFCDGDDRTLIAGQDEELRQRIATVCRRTLRRQAQEFLERPFVSRRARLFEYTMTGEERALYDDLTAFLMDPRRVAFRGSHRRLLLITFHRQMASSVKALAASLGKVAERLRAMLEETPIEALAAEAEAITGDLEDDFEATEVDEGAPPAPNRVETELEQVEALSSRAENLARDSKAEALIKAVQLVLEQAEIGDGRGKLVIFTESLTTQDYLRQLLTAAPPRGAGLGDEDVTLFRGHNAGPRAAAALERWKREVGDAIPAYNRPSREVAVRLALVHEFQTRSRVFVSTEAGAKGLNLQFCDTLVNYDLPWNPQRIEQRIGRCHRYGQERDVTVINFLAVDNEAQRLTYDILSRKLDLFGTVLGASDEVLHEPRTHSPGAVAGAMAVELEAQLQGIHERARSVQQIVGELTQLRDSIGERRDSYERELARTEKLIEAEFDDDVQRRFRSIQEELPETLAELDRDAERLLEAYLEAAGVPYQRREQDGHVRLEVGASAALPAELAAGITVVAGRARDLGDADPLHPGHPLILAAVAEARQATGRRFTVELPLGESPGSLGEHRGRRGRLVVHKVLYQGFEPVEHLIPAAAFETSGEVLPPEDAAELLALDPVDSDDATPLDLDDEEMDDVVEEALFVHQVRISTEEQQRFDRAIAQIERFVDDKVRVHERQRRSLARRLEAALRQRDAAMGAEARSRTERQARVLQRELDELDAEIHRLQARDDDDYETWRRRAHARRYAKPRHERILDVDFTLV